MQNSNLFNVSGTPNYVSELQQDMLAIIAGVLCAGEAFLIELASKSALAVVTPQATA